MKKSRRVFLTQFAVLSATSAIAKPLSRAGLTTKPLKGILPAGRVVTILHTNDLHGQTGAFLDGAGGLEQIKAVWQNQSQKGLLLDAGGFMAGTKNADKQARFIQTMNGMDYVAAGLSPRELAYGSDYLAGLARAMRFDLVNCNHEFSGPLSGVVKPYLVVYYNNIKVGITGVCARLKGFKYAAPLQSANKTASFLKNTEHCDLVICLSHLGSDNGLLAAQSRHIDMIVGSGQGNLMRNAQVLKNTADEDVVLATAGIKGITTGMSAFTFDGRAKKTGFQPDFLVARVNPAENAAIAFERLRQQKDQLNLV